VRQLEWGHIQGNQLAIRQQKTKETVYIPLCDMALKILAAHRGENVLPFPTTRILNLRVIERVRQHLLMLAKGAGISKHVTFHTSRHTFATMSITLFPPRSTHSFGVSPAGFISLKEVSVNEDSQN
jgi:integrase